jgi:hypothetical protein
MAIEIPCGQNGSDKQRSLLMLIFVYAAEKKYTLADRPRSDRRPAGIAGKTCSRIWTVDEKTGLKPARAGSAQRIYFRAHEGLSFRTPPTP